MRRRIYTQALVSSILLVVLGASMMPILQGTPNTYSISYEPYVDLKQPCSVESQSAENETTYYALIAACAEYKNESHNLPPPPLDPFSEEILKNLYNVLNQSKNWNTSNIRVLLNEKATKNNITATFEELAEHIGPNDIFLFSWCGHGAQIPDDDGDERRYDPNDTFDEAICPYDTELASDMLSDDELDYYFSQINAKGMCLIFESCFSGGMVAQTTESTTVGEAYDTTKGPYTFSDLNDPNRIVIMSTLPNCVCRLFPSGPPFSDAIAYSFGQYARDSNDDGIISAEEAFAIARVLYLAPSAALSVLYWISAYITVKTGIYKYYLEAPILKHIYNLPFYKRLIAFLYDDQHPLKSATRLLLFYWFYIQYTSLLFNGHFCANWANIHDDYPGELPLVEL